MSEKLFTEEMHRNIYIFSPIEQKDHKKSSKKIYGRVKPDIKKQIRKQSFGI